MKLATLKTTAAAFDAAADNLTATRKANVGDVDACGLCDDVESVKTDPVAIRRFTDAVKARTA